MEAGQALPKNRRNFNFGIDALMNGMTKIILPFLLLITKDIKLDDKIKSKNMSFFIHRERIDILTYTYNMHTQALITRYKDPNLK